jgi:hypothetical protein
MITSDCHTVSETTTALNGSCPGNWRIGLSTTDVCTRDTSGNYVVPRPSSGGAPFPSQLQVTLTLDCAP